MLQINGLDEGLEIFKCLGSDVRMNIMELLARNGEMNLHELAVSLKLTNGAITSHIRKLEECGMIRVESRHTGRGIQKVCSLKVDQMLLNVYPTMEERSTNVYETAVRIGHYSDYSVRPGCGLAGESAMIGAENDPRCFAYPEHLEAQLIWLHDGFIEYRIPNLLPEGHRIVQLTISFEVGSADQGMENDTSSKVRFFLNGSEISHWISLPEKSHTRGIYTPVWWNRHERQHGYLKMLVINMNGCFLDGVRMMQPEPGWDFLDEAGEMKLRFEAHPEDGLEGGIALYGNGFGNYKQDIMARIHYMPEDVFYG